MAKDYDPPMHSAEHILNQTMVRMFDCGRSVNAHIEKKKSRIDYRFQRNITEEEIKEIECRVNEVIETDMKVTEEFLTRDEAKKEFTLSKLPEDAGDLIRVIRIGNYDACPCSGQHITSTREIGVFRIISSTFDNGILRLRFKLG
ncbi:MAG: hypothetical protein QME52_11955 [Bacteroidota bacterium]|nr:hypothetical protein [Bacteroidota bacterium]